MDRSSPPVAAAFHECRSRAASDRGPPRACSLSKASAAVAQPARSLLHEGSSSALRRRVSCVMYGSCDADRGVVAYVPRRALLACGTDLDVDAGSRSGACPSKGILRHPARVPDSAPWVPGRSPGGSCGTPGAGSSGKGPMRAGCPQRGSSSPTSQLTASADGLVGGADAATRAQQSNTDQQMSFRNRWSSSTSSRIASESWSRCHRHSSRPAPSPSPSGAPARAALIA
jgi:hypothetical protein